MVTTYLGALLIVNNCVKGFFNLNKRFITQRIMDQVKVRSVPYGKIYRPVFDAEEQLIQSMNSNRQHKKNAPSPNLSNSFRTGNYF